MNAPPSSSPVIESEIEEDDAETSETCDSCDGEGASFRATKRKYLCEECYYAE